MISTETLVHCLANGSKGPGVPKRAVVIHFDDGYRDNASDAAPLLRAADLPAAFFIASGFIDTSRSFEHDKTKSPHRFENMTSEHVRQLAREGFEIGAHTVNHVDLGSVDAQTAVKEIVESRRALECILGAPVSLFSYPFGRPENITEDARTVIRDAGYRALFSAYGGAVQKKTDVLDIPRNGASSEHRPLDVMMEVAGLSLRDIAARFLQFRPSSARTAM
ncbi:MAG: polysaccharide deacetylase family protein [Bryobacteraceae bacterium]